MKQSYDYKKYAVLYVEDEEIARGSFERVFRDRFRIYTAANAREGLELIRKNKGDIGVLLTDQRMPGEKGVWLLEQARLLDPNIIRILVTAWADVDTALAAVNAGAVYKYLTKPFEEEEMETALKRALEFFLVQKERDQLLHERLSVLNNVMLAERMVSLGFITSGFCHHINNALVPVKTFLDLAPQNLRDENGVPLEQSEAWGEFYSLAQDGLRRMKAMLQELKNASQSASSTAFADNVPLEAVIEEVVRDLKGALDEKRLTVSVDIPDKLPALRADRAKIYRLFELLLKDELVTLKEGGQLTFSASEIRNVKGEPEIEIRLKDNGAPLPTEMLRFVFNPFAVTVDRPTEYGINLMGCYFIVHNHGGHIEALSNETDGNVFRIQLPINPLPVDERDVSETDFLSRVQQTEARWSKVQTS